MNSLERAAAAALADCVADDVIESRPQVCASCVFEGVVSLAQPYERFLSGRAGIRTWGS